LEQKKLIAAAGGFVLLLLLFFVLTGDGCNGKRSFSWRETYDETSKQPYGAYVFYELLKDKYQSEKFVPIADSLVVDLPIDTTSFSEKANYVFVGSAMFTDSASTQTLLSFVEQGNNAFISSKSIPYDLMFYIYYDECNEIYWDDYAQVRDSMAQINVLHPNLRNEENFQFKYLKQFSATNYNWNYIDPNVFCEEENSFVELGQMNDFYPNFARILYGKGYFYLHTTPMAFSNLSLQEEQSLAYASKIIAHLDGEKVYYDTYNRISEGVSRRRNERQNFFQNNRTFNNESELSYILSQPALRWAWYLTLALVLLYLVFRAKRQQRIIPVTEPNRNTSLEFVGTIGQLYFQQENHQKLARQKFKLWQNFVRDKYRITSKDLDEDFVKRLAAKSDVSQSDIHAILQQYNIIQRATGIQQHTLIDFHAVMERFYQACK